MWAAEETVDMQNIRKTERFHPMDIAVYDIHRLQDDEGCKKGTAWAEAKWVFGQYMIILEKGPQESNVPHKEGFETEKRNWRGASRVQKDQDIRELWETTERREDRSSAGGNAWNSRNESAGQEAKNEEQIGTRPQRSNTRNGMMDKNLRLWR